MQLVFTDVTGDERFVKMITYISVLLVVWMFSVISCRSIGHSYDSSDMMQETIWKIWRGGGQGVLLRLTQRVKGFYVFKEIRAS